MSATNLLNAAKDALYFVQSLLDEPDTSEMNPLEREMHEARREARAATIERELRLAIRDTTN